MLDKTQFLELIDTAFSDNKIKDMLTEKIKDSFFTLATHLLTENEKYNLTAIKTPSGVAALHFADCALLARMLPEGARVSDVGCGAGFPSLPIAILRPDVTVTAIDSTQKRINFVNECISLLGLSNINAVCLRAEDAARRADMREKFDVATARAVAELRVLCELCMPFVRVGGKFISMKGSGVAQESEAAKGAIRTLCGAVVGESEIFLNNFGESVGRSLIEIKKISVCPPKYPRPYSQIVKKPL